MNFEGLKKLSLTSRIFLTLVLVFIGLSIVTIRAQRQGKALELELVEIVGKNDPVYKDSPIMASDTVAMVYEAEQFGRPWLASLGNDNVYFGDLPESILAPLACALPHSDYSTHTSTIDRTNFCVYYDPTSTVTLAQATTAADHVENIYWPTLTAELGKAPKSIGKLEIYLVKTTSGCNGGTGWSSNKYTTYQTCITPDILFQKVLGHELTHRVQYNHDDGSGSLAAPHQTKTFKEGSARAIEDQFAPQDTWVGALGFSSSYAGQAKSAYATPNRDWWAYGWRYHFAPAWKYFSEQYPGGTTTEPGYGWDYYQRLYECTTSNVGIAAVNCAQLLSNGPGYYEMWKKFGRSLYTKDLTIATLPNQQYYFLDEQQAGDQPGAVAKNVGPTITSASSKTWGGESVSQDGLDYYEVPIGADCEAPTVSFTAVLGNPYLWVVGRSGDEYRFDVGGTASGGSWSQSILKTDETHLAAVVVGLSASASLDIEMSCGTPVLDIKEPLQLAPDYVQPLDGIVVQVLVTNGSPTSPVISGFSYLDFTAQIDGNPALIMAGGFVEEQYFLLVQAPDISNGPKDLTISLGSATDTEIEAVVYDATNSDNVIVIDRSGSMGWYSAPPILAAKAAANFFIDASNSSEGLAVVGYNHNLDPTPVGMGFGTLPQRTAAHNFVNGLSASGGTSIGDGLGAPGGGAVSQVTGSPTGNARCQIILLSDGNENSALFWSDVQAAVVGTGCPVMSIAFGPGANETLMQTIASATGGLAFYNDVFVSTQLFAENAITAEDMHLDLADTYLYTQEQGEGRDRLLAEKGEALDAGEVHTHTINVDASMTSLMATLDWTVVTQEIGRAPGNSAPVRQERPFEFELRLVSPSGVRYVPGPDADGYAFFDRNSGHVGYRIPSPETGEWDLVVERLSKGPKKYEVHASGESQISVDLILLDQLQLDQTTGQEVPIRALVPVRLGSRNRLAAAGQIAVMAKVTAPDGTVTMVPLYDDGQHNQYDLEEGDGLWAGVYTLVTQAENVDQVGEDGYTPKDPVSQGGYRVVVDVEGADFAREAKGAFAVLEGVDSTGDGVPDVYVEQYGPANEDPDLDLLDTGDEYYAGTNPHHSDSDSDDGILRESDWSEVNNAQDPLNSADDQILAPEECSVLGKNGLVEITYDVKPEYDAVQAYRRVNGGSWDVYPENLPLDTGGLFTDTLNIVNGSVYEYQIHAVDIPHTSAQVLCGIAMPLENWRPPDALMRLDDGVSTPDLEVEIEFFAYEGGDGILDFNEIHEMRISNSPDFTGIPWEAFQETGKIARISGLTPPGGIATMYAEFRNMDGLTSDGPSVASIRYEPVGVVFLPIVIK